MPCTFAPTKSGAHRLTCRALYKNLLLACSQFRPAEALKSESQLSTYLKSLIRYRFHHDRTLQSPHQIRDALIFGRKAVGILDKASHGVPEALKRLTTILNSVQSELQTSPQFKSRTKKDGQTNVAPCDLQRPSTTSAPLSRGQQNSTSPSESVSPSESIRAPIPILSRPVPLSALNQNSGKPRRIIPRYIVSNGVPFLRYHKPQPVGVSRMIRNLTIRREKRWILKREMARLADLATLEDDWDREMERQLKSLHEGGGAQYSNKIDNTSDRDGGSWSWSWSWSFKLAESEISKKLKAQELMLHEKGKAFWNVFVQERELARQEKEAARKEKHERRSKSVSSAPVETLASTIACSLTPEVT